MFWEQREWEWLKVSAGFDLLWTHRQNSIINLRGSFEQPDTTTTQTSKPKPLNDSWKSCFLDLKLYEKVYWIFQFSSKLPMTLPKGIRKKLRSRYLKIYILTFLAVSAFFCKGPSKTTTSWPRNNQEVDWYHSPWCQVLVPNSTDDLGTKTGWTKPPMPRSPKAWCVVIVAIGKSSRRTCSH